MSSVEHRIGDLVAHALDGNEDAVATLYGLYHQKLVGVAHRRLGHTLHGLMESVDLVQSVWRDVLQALHQFEDRGPDSFFHWLHECLIRKINSKRRFHRAEKRRAKRSTPLPEYDVLPQTTERTPSQNAAMNDEVAHLMQILEKFPEAQREVLLLRMRDGLTYQEIGERIGKSMEAVKKIYHRSLDRLIDLLPR